MMKNPPAEIQYPRSLGSFRDHWGGMVAVLLAGLLGRADAAEPVVISGLAGDVFSSVGVTPDGAYVVSGTRGNEAGYFEIRGNQVAFQRIGAAAVEPFIGLLNLFPEKHVSRDGRYIIARDPRERVKLWDRINHRLIPFPDDRVWPYPIAVCLASIGGEPLLAGTSLESDGPWPTRWSPTGGYQVARDSGNPWRTYDALTRDGRIAGTGVLANEFKGLVGVEDRFDTILQRYGNDRIGVTAVSPNGRVISGWLAFPPFRAAMLWTNGEPHHLFLPLDEPASLTGAVTDSGFAGGLKVNAQPVSRGFIFDPYIGQVRWFDEWWDARFPTAPLQGGVTHVVDLLDHGDSLLCVLQGVTSRLAIVPRPHRGLATPTAMAAAEPVPPVVAEAEASPTPLQRGRWGRPAGPAAPEPSIARIWNEEILAAIRIDLPHPPAHARNLFHLSIAMYDAWAAYHPTAPGVIYHGKHQAADVAAARRAAISHAAYRILRERYALSRNAVSTLFLLDQRMLALGYDKTQTTLDPTVPAGVGNLVAGAVSSYYLEDGARQLQLYRDKPRYEGGHAPFNPPLITLVGGVTAWDINRWQPLSISGATSQNGIPLETVQSYVGAQWADVRPFALVREAEAHPWIDPGPPPHLGESTDAVYRDLVVEHLRYSSELTPEDGVTLDISPASWGNHPLGPSTGRGYTNNPVTGQPYTPNVVKRGDFARVLAEFWADGPTSETPPGHWNVLANYITDHPLFIKRLGGQGPVLEDLEWDVKLYLSLNGALHDAACAAWTLKRYYDGWRPISAVRLMGQRGQSSDPSARLYHPDGLPLVPGLIELQFLPQPGGQGAPIPTIMVNAWRGQPPDPKLQIGGVGWIPANTWLPYQRRTFITPAFPGYVSGHSTFSRAAAEVLTEFTGSPYFPGGLGTFTAPANTYLAFERGPSTSVELQWASYYDAADQAGFSRQWGGIHVSVDDFVGRRVGAEVGKNAWRLARRFIEETVADAPLDLTIHTLENGQCELRFHPVRGQVYRLQATDDLTHPFVDVPGSTLTAKDSWITYTEPGGSTAQYFRVVTVRRE